MYYMKHVQQTLQASTTIIAGTGNPAQSTAYAPPRFMLDRDQIFYSKAFRRLAGKAQVYITGENDHKRNRLTHTLEVSQIARSIGQSLGLDLDLVEAIALGHDLGHTPFGHAGERILHNIMTPQTDHMLGPCCPMRLENYKYGFPKELKNFLGFKHNLQSAVVAMELEKNMENRGLNLTPYTLYGMMAHSSTEYKPERMHNHDLLGYYTDYLDRGCKVEKKWAWSLEALLVAEADEIAQWHHDMEDALLGGLITPAELVKLAKPVIEHPDNGRKPTDAEWEILNNPENYDLGVFTAAFTRVFVDLLMTRMAEVAQEKIKKIGQTIPVSVEAKNPGFNSKNAHVFVESHEPNEKEIKEIFSYGDKKEEGSFAKAVKAFSDEIAPRVLSSHEIQMNDAKGQYIIKKLFQAYYANPQQLPDHSVFEFLSQYHAMREDPDMKISSRNREGMEGYVKVKSEKELRSEALKKGVGSVRRTFGDLFSNRDANGILEEILLMRTICNHIAGMTDSYAKKTYEALYG